MSNKINDFLLGFFCPLRGIKLILTVPKLKYYVLAPVIVYFLVFWGLLGVASSWINELRLFMLVFFDMTGFWMSVLSFFTQMVAWFVTIVFSFYLVVLLSGVIASPFYSIIVEKIIRSLGTNEGSSVGFKQMLLLSLKMFNISLIRMMIMLVVSVIFLVLSFVPLVNIIIPVFLILILTMDCVDYSFEVLLFSLKNRFSFFFSHFSAFAGMSLSLGLVMILPGINFLLFPAFVAGGAELVYLLMIKEE